MALPETKTPDAESERSQIKSRERVRDLAEVYTHEREVNAMLDLVADRFPGQDDPANIDRTFLEPACGSGNFLVEILRRKLEYVTPRRYGRGERFEHRLLRCLASIYGIDISADNVEESRDRLRAMLGEHLKVCQCEESTPGFRDAVEAILVTNIVQADTLAEAASIELVEYLPGEGGTFVREWSRPLDLATSEPTLFGPSPRSDEVPVHYSELGCQTGPVVLDPVERRAA